MLGLYNKSGKILFLGLDNAGKTTLLHMLKSEKLAQHNPTQHPNSEDLTMGNLSFKAVDLGGHELARKLWRDYFCDVSAIVFLVDVADAKRFQESRKELTSLLADEQLQSIPFLILGNKIDKSGAVSEDELKGYLGLHGLTTGKDERKADGSFRPLEVFMCSIMNNQGYGQGFRWLANYF